VRAHLSPHKYPRDVRFVAELPKTPSGKIDRRALRAEVGVAA
jgi:acetyl-CoA synthetase